MLTEVLGHKPHALVEFPKKRESPSLVPFELSEREPVQDAATNLREQRKKIKNDGQATRQLTPALRVVELSATRGDGVLD